MGNCPSSRPGNYYSTQQQGWIRE